LAQNELAQSTVSVLSYDFIYWLLAKMYLFSKEFHLTDAVKSLIKDREKAIFQPLSPGEGAQGVTAVNPKDGDIIANLVVFTSKEFRKKETHRKDYGIGAGRRR
jgi:hypothetical protein